MDHVYESLADLKRALDALPDQESGYPNAVSNIGEPYLEFFACGVARPGDEEVVERHVAKTIGRQLLSYLQSRSGKIYWRTPFEFERRPHQEVLRFDPDGEDTDFVTDRKCVMDKSWVGIAAYCRLVRAKM